MGVYKKLLAWFYRWVYFAVGQSFSGGIHYSLSSSCTIKFSATCIVTNIPGKAVCAIFTLDIYIFEALKLKICCENIITLYVHVCRG